MADRPIPKEFEGLADLTWGIGETADGTINTFPLSELNARTQARDREEKTAEEMLLEPWPEDEDED